MNLNNVNTGRVMELLEAGRNNPSALRKTSKVVGTWNLDENEPQFSSVLKFETGELKLEADQPGAQGGKGLRPGPVIYCLYGLAACFSATFTTLAALEGIKIDELKIEIENDVNFGAAFGLSDEPIIEEVRVKLSVRSDSDRGKLEELLSRAENSCPASYCLKNPIRMKANLEK